MTDFKKMNDYEIQHYAEVLQAFALVSSMTDREADFQKLLQYLDDHMLIDYFHDVSKDVDEGCNHLSEWLTFQLSEDKLH